jgi:hypothetical protein
MRTNLWEGWAVRSAASTPPNPVDGGAEAKRRRSWVAPEGSGLRGSGDGHCEMTFLFCSTTGDNTRPDPRETPSLL